MYGWLLCCLATVASPADEPPRLVELGAVAPTVLALTIEAQRVVYGDQVPYHPEPGDTYEGHRPGTQWAWVRRGGKPIGTRIGPRFDVLQQPDRVEGRPLDTAWADQPASYRLSSPDDPAYATPTAPKAVHRKSKASDLARTGPWDWGASVTHRLYLVLPSPLVPGHTYRLVFAGGPWPEQTLRFAPEQQRSEAVHVNQLGFRPADRVKVAYLSCWLGTGGALTYPAGLPFRVIDDASGATVFTGKSVLSRAAGEPEDVYKRNYTGTDVHRLDFGELNRPGVYRVVVDGVGSSVPFPVREDVWRAAFTTAARGFYHQRSGIALGPPYTSFVRPRSFHPDDGVKVTQSTCSLMDSGNGLSARGDDTGNFGNLVKGRTETIVPNAWGGYFDAGDWDRRIQHLDATRLLLELAELHPEFVGSVKLNLPESDGKLPDLVHEALWNVDFYRRLQLPDGGVRGGIESSEHPNFGEGSWQESSWVMAYAPDPWSSHLYAAAAAQAATVLARWAPARAAVYRDTALRAAEWAEADLAKRGEAKLPFAVRDARNLAAVALYRLTGDERWHRLFLATTVLKEPVELTVWQKHDQADAAFLYACLPADLTDATVRANCLAGYRKLADATAAGTKQTAFGWTKDNPWKPIGWGLLSTPQVIGLLRAQHLAPNPAYPRALAEAVQFGAGANPSNLCYTTGVGVQWPQHPLWTDARILHQPAPPGLTVYGPRDLSNQRNGWEMKVLGPYCTPFPADWPAAEAYFDVFWFPAITEFTVVQNLGPIAYIWGSLAAGRQTSINS